MAKIKRNKHKVAEEVGGILGKYAKKVNEDIYKDIRFLTEDEDADPDNEEATEDAKKNEKVTDEQLRVDSLKIAVKLSRLMNKVTAEDILEISTKVAAYLKDHQVGAEYVPAEDPDAPAEGDENVEEVEDEETEEVVDDENGDETEEDTTEETEEFTVPDEDVEDNDEEESEGADEEEFVIPDEFL